MNGKKLNNKYRSQTLLGEVPKMPVDNSTPIVFTQLSADHIKGAVDVLSRAFDEDPVFTFYLYDPRRRKFAYRPFFGDFIRSNLRFGHVYVALMNQRVVAVSIWRPPGAGAATPKERFQSFVATLAVRIFFPKTAKGLFQGFHAMHILHPKEPYWYLGCVGVDTGLQGKGIGTRLLEPVLEIADRTNTLCYVETPFPRDIVFYQRLGFEIASESHPFIGAPPVWIMTREPKGVSS